MNLLRNALIVFLGLLATSALFAQTDNNCFLRDFELKTATIPPYKMMEKTTSAPTVTVTISARDTLGKVSRYIFGNALPSWLGNSVMDATFIGHLRKLAPTLIRYPGGSWGDIFFWSGNPGDLPNTISDGANNGAPIALSPQFGVNSWPTTLDNYYNMRDQLGATQGLITINYAYARYGLSEKPVEQAAHYAADWVRYESGITKFWEIGNENGGPWEAGWQIDTTKNRDGQPQIITGELYGEHFKIFADSMRAAAAEMDETIYIGGQVLHKDGTGSWNVADRLWNEGFFSKVGDAADFYVMHNYYGGGAVTVKGQVESARAEILRNINFIRQDIVKKKAPSKPIAVTEWNCTGPDQAKTAYLNGVEAVVLFSEMIINNVGMSCRWPLANYESDGMFYKGNNTQIPVWNPRPDFFYVYYLQRFFGDHAVKTAVTGSSDVLAYASTFSSGHTGVVLVNKGATEQIVKLALAGIGVDDLYYVYTLTGGTDNVQLSQKVYVNDVGPTGAAWGPLNELEKIQAYGYAIENEIKLVSPPRSVQYVLITNGNRIIAGVSAAGVQTVGHYALGQNYPNPFNAQTAIAFSLSQTAVVDLKLYDVTGREIVTLVSGQKMPAGQHQLSFDAAKLSSGVYIYSLQTGNFRETKKMVLIR